MDNDWKFSDSRNTPTITSTGIIRDRQVILFTSRDADDGTWQFHTDKPVDTSDAVVVSLEEIVKHDKTIGELSDLPVGWTAQRKTASDTWVRKDEHGRIVR